MQVNTICDLKQIYNEHFQFSLPKVDLENQLSGTAFDHKEPYTEKEFEDLCGDINELSQTIFQANPTKEKIAVMTAGAPGAGKTTLMKQDIESERNRTGKVLAYTDPDDVCLKGMKRTYLADIQLGQDWKDAYTKWRPGSNSANNLLLGNLVREGYGFYFGTTATSPFAGNFFALLKNQGYKIRLIHVSAPDDVRWESIKERDKSFVQTTEKDTREKGLLFPQRISDTYLKYADHIDFYLREKVQENAVLGATWVKEERRLTIHHPEAYSGIKKLHNEMVEKLGKADLSWEKTVEAQALQNIKG